MKRAAMAAGALVLAVLTGPLVTVIAAEVSLMTETALPVPIWDEHALEVFLAACAIAALTFALCLLGIFVKGLRRMALFLAGIAAYAVLAAFSFMVLFVHTLNVLYGRYEPALSHSTEWATGYSEAGFDLIRPGMDVTEVLRIIGEPLTRNASGDQEVWLYSLIGPVRSQAEQGYRQRMVTLERGRVVTTRKRYLTTEHKPF